MFHWGWQRRNLVGHTPGKHHSLQHMCWCLDFRIVAPQDGKESLDDLGLQSWRRKLHLGFEGCMSSMHTVRFPVTCGCLTPRRRRCRESVFSNSYCSIMLNVSMMSRILSFPQRAEATSRLASRQNDYVLYICIWVASLLPPHHSTQSCCCFCSFVPASSFPDSPPFFCFSCSISSYAFHATISSPVLHRCVTNYRGLTCCKQTGTWVRTDASWRF